MSNQATDGQPGGQGRANAPSESQDSSGRQETSRGSEDVEDLKARVDLLNDNFAELRNAILTSRQGSGRAEIEEISDDEPLTASKVNKIVEKNLTRAVASSTQLQERRQWDDKAKSEFPLADPKFLREFKREWKEMVDSGLDPNHPKAVYQVAKATARTVGVRKEPGRQEESSTQTSEAASSGTSSQRTERRGTRNAISDDDPRIRFYRMKGPKTKERIEAIKQKLGERDAKRRAR